MKSTLVMSYGNFLHHKHNSAGKFLETLSVPQGFAKAILPVWYLRKEILKPILRHSPKRIIVLGMHAGIDAPRFETVAKNEMVVLKNPLYRASASIYSRILNAFGRNITTKKPIPKEMQTIVPIEAGEPEKIKLHTPVKNLGMTISKDAGNFVCNYCMWLIERSIRKDVEFYFLHVPKNLSEKQKKALSEFILGP